MGFWLCCTVSVYLECRVYQSVCHTTLFSWITSEKKKGVLWQIRFGHTAHCIFFLWRLTRTMRIFNKRFFAIKRTGFPGLGDMLDVGRRRHIEWLTWRWWRGLPDSLKEERGRFVREDEDFVSDLLLWGTHDLGLGEGSGPRWVRLKSKWKLWDQKGQNR